MGHFLGQMKNLIRMGVRVLFMDQKQMEHLWVKKEDMTHLVHFAASSHLKGASHYLKKLARSYRLSEPDLFEMIIKELRTSPVRAAPQSSVAQPVDADSRLSLVKEKSVAELLENAPILNPEVEAQLQQLVNEQLLSEKLFSVGLDPTKTALFVGPPGVGKTISAEWIARQLEIPLLTLDLSAVMSSYLGKTGVNVRRVFEHARSMPCVLFLDELDAVAKKRDDSGEIGELKRLVTVLLQEIDAWPSGSLLLAATNHAQLLDPAVWRRFETVVDFPLPTNEEILRALNRFLSPAGIEVSEFPFLPLLYDGETISAIERSVQSSLRKAVLTGAEPATTVIEDALRHIRQLPKTNRAKVAANAQRATGMSARSISELTGVSRNTLRKYTSILENGDH